MAAVPMSSISVPTSSTSKWVNSVNVRSDPWIPIAAKVKTASFKKFAFCLISMFFYIPGSSCQNRRSTVNHKSFSAYIAHRQEIMNAELRSTRKRSVRVNQSDNICGMSPRYAGVQFE